MEANEAIDQKAKAKQLVKQGYHLCQRGNYPDGAKYFKEAAALGDLEAVYGLAFLYYEGKGVEKDLAEATRCFETLANQECNFREVSKLRLERLADIDSGNGIGIIGVDKDYEIACGCGFGDDDVKLYRSRWKWAREGYLKAQKEVAYAIFILLDCDQSNHPDADGETMMKYLRKFAELGDAQAQETLAEVYYNDGIVAVGIGDVDHEEAVKWFRKAAKGGDDTAQYLLETEFGEKVETDKGEALFEQMHHIENRGQHADYYIEKIGFPYVDWDGDRDEQWYTRKEVFELCKRFAEQGDAVSQKNLGIFYSSGVCVKKNYAQAVKWFTKAAEQDNAESQLMLGDLYFEGKKVKQDFDKAAKWYLEAANHSEGWHDCEGGSWLEYWSGFNLATWRACKRLGQCYHEGKGVKQNDETAASWYEKAGRILMENPRGEGKLCDIAESYFDGDGIYQDYMEAIKWYKRAAERGHLYSQRRLSEMYEEGEVVPQDYKEAFKWYNKMAESKDKEALYIIGVCYLEGKGVKPNKKEALDRIRKAASFGSKEAKKKLLELGEK